MRSTGDSRLGSLIALVSPMSTSSRPVPSGLSGQVGPPNEFAQPSGWDSKGSGSEMRLSIQKRSPNTSPSFRLLPTDTLTMHLVLSDRSEEHTSELQSLMRISYAVFCLKKKNTLSYTKQLTTSCKL